MSDTLLVDRKQAAAIVAISVATWDRMVAAGKTPAPIYLSRGCVRYIDSQDRRCRKDSPNARKVVKTSGTWRGEYRDASGVVRSVTLCSNKQASRQMLAELERKAMQQKSGLVSPYDEHARRPLVEHLEEFVQTLRDAGNTEEHCQLVETRVRHVVTNCRFRFIAEISGSNVLRCLAELKSQQNKTQQTVNHYLRAIKQFTRWLVRDHRTDDEDCGCLIAIDEAERGGFEPPVPLRARRFSRPVHSTALPSLRAGGSLGVTRWSNKEIAGVTNSWSLKARHVRRPIPSLAVAGVVQIEIVASARPAMLRRRPLRRSRRSIRFVARSIL